MVTLIAKPSSKLSFFFFPNCEQVMAGSESILPALFEQETLDDTDEDVDMLDAEIDDPKLSISHAESGRSLEENGKTEKQQPQGVKNPQKKERRRKKKKKRFSSNSVTDINRFVIDTCRHLKEKKSYLVWNAVGCLGVSVMRELVREVDIIQNCGGQLTADGKRSRNGGGILWNILKTREPNAYKEIMKKGKEFENQFRQQNTRGVPKKNSESGSVSVTCQNAPSAQTNGDGEGVGVSILNRMRVPVTYDDDVLGEDAKEDVAQS